MVLDGGVDVLDARKLGGRGLDEIAERPDRFEGPEELLAAARDYKDGMMLPYVTVSLFAGLVICTRLPDSPHPDTTNSRAAIALAAACERLLKPRYLPGWLAGARLAARAVVTLTTTPVVAA